MTKSQNLIHHPGSVAQKVDDEKSDIDLENVEFEYDIVIVGGGTAGCVLASRLSEEPNLHVLLIEAGGSSKELLKSRIPSGFIELFKSEHDYTIITEPQTNADNATKFWPRGKMLGGCSAMNAMMFQEGAPSDYDEWARTGLPGAEEWGYQSFRKYFLKFEKYNPHPSYPDVDLKERGQDGPVNVGYFGYCAQATTKFIKACVNLGIPHNPDVNSPSNGTLGVTKIMTYIDKTGTRVTSESAYLTPEVLKRTNLKVVIHSTCTRIFFRENEGKKRAVGLEFAQRKGSVNTFFRAKVKRELIIAAGAISSPQILLLSGVGPREQLEKHGIPVVHELPGVGRGLQDHAIVNTRLGLKPGHSLQHLFQGNTPDKIRTLIDLARWMVFGSGSLTTNVGEAAAFVRSDDTKLFGPDKYQVKDETSGPGAPDIEVLVVPIGFVEHATVHKIHTPSMTLAAVGLRPQSRGTVELRSPNPFDSPLVDPKYFTKPNDLAVLVRGLKLLINIAKTEPLVSALNKVDHPLLDHDLDQASDEVLENEVKKRVETLYHPTSTCRMAKLEDEGVVDAQLKVHGLENVRVVDASIFPQIPAGHTTAPVYAVAEKAADIIKKFLA